MGKQRVMPKTGPFQKYIKKYEDWFNENKYAYESEINAIKEILPEFKSGIEIGVGSGRFALPLKIDLGIEPSPKMGKIAETRGINVIDAVAENIPFEDESFDMVLMVTTLCFLDDARKAFSEIYRVLEPKGYFVNGFVDKNSRVGRIYQKYKDKSIFYSIAVFYSTEEVVKLLKEAGFKNIEFRQTIFNTLNNINKVEPVKEGFGQGSFIVVLAQK